MKFSPMHLLDQLLLAGPTWIGVTVTVAAILLLHVLRHFLPRSQRSRGKVTLLWFYLALLCRLGAVIALKAGAYTTWVLLSFLDLMGCTLGIIGLLRLLVLELGINRRRVRVPLIVSDLIHVGIVLVVVLVILYQQGLDPLSLVTTSAVITAIIGLALQSTIANVFAGLALHTDKTIGIGDWVQIGALIGRIAEVKWRSTALWTEDGDFVIVPNSRLLDSEVRNLSRPDDVQRMTIEIGFHYRHPPNDVKRVLLDVARDVPGVRQEPAPDCVVRTFDESAVLYALRYWISDYTDHMRIESDIRTRLWYAARRAELEMPFPIQTVHLASTPHTAKMMREDELSTHQRTTLAQARLFTNTTADIRSSLAEHVRLLEYGAGETIVAATDIRSPLHLIQRGEVEAVLVVGDSRRLLSTLGPGDCFGGMSIQAGESHLVMYIAKTDVTCGGIDNAALAPILATQPQLAEEVAALLAAQEMSHHDGVLELSAEAQSRQAAEVRSRILTGLRRAFRLS